MKLTETQTIEIEDFLKKTLLRIILAKSTGKNKEPDAKPFHERLIGKERMALFSFIQGLNTSFGTGIFESVAGLLAKPNFKIVKPQIKAGSLISEEAFKVIQNIMNDLISARSLPDKETEIERIREVCQKGVLVEVKPTKVDVFLEDENNELFFFDIKTVKPNMGGFKEFKRTLLEWVAAVLADNPNAKINTLIAIPYNPYDPQPYNRWTMRGMLDLSNELKVAEEFWDFLGGTGAYLDLLDIFERVGIELRGEIDEYFQKFNVK